LGLPGLRKPTPTFSVTVGKPFYLASWAGYNYADPQPNIGPGDPFFWGKFAVEVEGLDTTLVLLDSALATGTGIYVGTTVAVPEPSMLAVAGVATSALAAWRCRRR